MTTLQISLPENLKHFVEEQAAKSGYETPSAYVEALIDAVRIAQSGVSLEKELLKGLDSGKAVEADEAYWSQFRTRHRQRLEKAAI